MSRGQNHVVLGDDFDAALRNFRSFSIEVEHRQRRWSDSRGRKFALNFRPERQLHVAGLAVGGKFRRGEK